jgi:hypothetical protein
MFAMRIAAWLYLEHRVKGPKIEEDPAMQTLYRDLGRAASAGPYDLGDDESIKMADYIDQRLQQLGLK